ncbi:iron-containing alcohol dehydrogenase PsrA [Virgifigura deserti]|uniref:iron-containing alcohol dehydrogenase PsrA n=1 Tax=Virgifigura deserti TaxID=2268457 RepID=UPI003CCC2933
MWRFHNPVRVRFGAGAIEEVGALVAGRPYCLVTYDEPAFAEISARIRATAGNPAILIDDVQPNPDFSNLTELCARYGEARPAPRVIVAVGGGSVMDSAKVLAVADGDFSRVSRHLEQRGAEDRREAVPIIAVPTTAGTGSEMTCWGTVWHAEAGRKYSLSRSDLYAEWAVVDPELTLGAPRSLTVATGLDALSHALESLWNVNHNPVSGALAVAAAREMIETLPRLVDDLGNLDLRTRVAKAALLAGLAFSNTKTALAHNISYPITLRHGIPHGLACSFSLPMVMRSAVGASAECDAALAAIFDGDLKRGADRLEGFLASLGVSVETADYGISEAEWREIVEEAFRGERGRNFIGAKDGFLSR